MGTSSMKCGVGLGKFLPAAAISKREIAVVNKVEQ